MPDLGARPSRTCRTITPNVDPGFDGQLVTAHWEDCGEPYKGIAKAIAGMPGYYRIDYVSLDRKGKKWHFDLTFSPQVHFNPKHLCLPQVLTAAGARQRHGIKHAVISDRFADACYPSPQKLSPPTKDKNSEEEDKGNKESDEESDKSETSEEKEKTKNKKPAAKRKKTPSTNQKQPKLQPKQLLFALDKQQHDVNNKTEEQVDHTNSKSDETPDELMALALQAPTHTYTSVSGELKLPCKVLPSTKSMQTTESRILLCAAEDQCHYDMMVVQTANVCTIEEHEKFRWLKVAQAGNGDSVEVNQMHPNPNVTIQLQSPALTPIGHTGGGSKEERQHSYRYN